ncbi:NAD(P)/FAD-dependent oxidoreductase [Amantichitinum ursilacus]|uniref:Hydroxyneurosporene desaturase n=1 Tax=Amantichitinum ursilacus TaxID=857265 RepID=A0A0N0GQF0_9NEIS|nr:FAD-dependent oxidoreductase [Amantichitinum ursilacus]KPC54620.1 Hydroxyneurosporene desaturase [Amantichitinum ursilacus]
MQEFDQAGGLHPNGWGAPAGAPAATHAAEPSTRRIAVVGAGIAGLASAWLLQRRGYQVTLYEAANVLGGHAHTVDVRLDGWIYPVDTGFTVFEDRSSPNLHAFFDALGVQTVNSERALGVSLDEGALEWSSTDLLSVFAQRRNLASPRFLRMLRELLRFNAEAAEQITVCSARGTSLGELLQQGGYGKALRDWHLLPLAASLWHCSLAAAAQIPAASFLRLCQQQGLLRINERPQWRTVAGGAREYIFPIDRELHDVRRCSPVREIHRTGFGVTVVSGPEAEQFDEVVLATPAATSLRLLHNASAAERTALGAFEVQHNVAVLHTDTRLLPQRRSVWSASNYLGGKDVAPDQPVCISYLLNQMQPLPFRTPVILTLNPRQAPAPAQTLGQFRSAQPVLNNATLQAQHALQALQGRNRVWYAGAWLGQGLHEDGLRSALRVAAAFDALPPWATLEEPPLAEIMAGLQSGLRDPLRTHDSGPAGVIG